MPRIEEIMLLSVCLKGLLLLIIKDCRILKIAGYSVGYPAQPSFFLQDLYFTLKSKFLSSSFSTFAQHVVFFYSWNIKYDYTAILNNDSITSAENVSVACDVPASQRSFAGGIGSAPQTNFWWKYVFSVNFRLV